MSIRSFREFLPLAGDVFFRQWTLPGARATVCIVHGLGEHCGRYERVAAYLGQSKVAVCSADLPGHGMTSGKRGHIPSLDACYELLDRLLAIARTSNPDAPLFLYGHSMGGNLALNYLLDRRPAIIGAVITSPWIALPKEPPRLLVAAIPFLARCCPAFTVSNGLDPNDLALDPAVAAAYIADPLTHDRISFRAGWFLFEAARRLKQWKGALSVPLMFHHGTADAITDHRGTEAFAGRCESATALHLWPAMRHELHNEAIMPQLLDEVVAWIGRPSTE